MRGRKGFKLVGKQPLLLCSILVSAFLSEATLDMENPTETQEPFLGGKSSAGKCFQEDTQNFRYHRGIMYVQDTALLRRARGTSLLPKRCASSSQW